MWKPLAEFSPSSLEFYFAVQQFLDSKLFEVLYSKPNAESKREIKENPGALKVFLNSWPFSALKSTGLSFTRACRII